MEKAEGLISHNYSLAFCYFPFFSPVLICWRPSTYWEWLMKFIRAKVSNAIIRLRPSKKKRKHCREEGKSIAFFACPFWNFQILHSWFKRLFNPLNCFRMQRFTSTKLKIMITHKWKCSERLMRWNTSWFLVFLFLCQNIGRKRATH